MNFPLLRSTLCHLSFLSSFSTFLSPLMWRTRSSSTSTFTSSFFSPGTSALNTCLRSLLPVHSGIDNSRGKSLNGSQTSREKGSKTLLRRPPKKLGMSDIWVVKLVSFISSS
ncbi:hypothetical protein F8388_002192 [Cannabis sativa]|uniref:Secreted protein n=1 Tax=Cannabis sativa TaxID=3483 RepID=A0A7J6FU46_CANSA|nr:hypothetical protein F8388_002192 [Cannabis sativa]